VSHNRALHRLVPLLGTALFGMSVWVLHRELHQIGFATLKTSLASVSADAAIAALLLTALNYIVLTCHDQLAFAYAGVRLAHLPIAIASFVGYAISNNVGFAMLSGTSARYRFYSRWGVSAADLSRIVLFYSTTFWLGLCVLGGASLLAAPPPGLDRVVPAPVATAAGMMTIGVVVLYAVACAVRRRPVVLGRLVIPLPAPKLMAAQVTISTIDWLLAASVLFVLIPSPRPEFLVVAGAFGGAQLLGLVSHVPGGLGVFEGLMLLLLAPQVTPAALVPALALYRVVYYLAPLAAAMVVLLVDEGLQRRRTVTEWSRAPRAIAVWAAPRILAVFTFVSGAALLLSGATPAEPGRVAWLAHVMPLPLVEVSHFAASLTGLLLLLLAQAISERVDAAFYTAAAALVVGSLASIFKGGDYEEAVLLLAVLAALLGARRHFTRPARVFQRPLSAGWLAATTVVVAASVWLGLFAYRHVAYSNELFWAFALNADAPRFLRATVAVTIVALAVAIRQLLRPALHRPAPADAAALEAAATVIDRQPLTFPNLVYLEDKALFWNAGRSAFVMYGVRGSSWVALGDPVGPAEEAAALIPRFVTDALRRGAAPVFYEASPAYLTHYVDHGLAALKIGEEARVPLDRFSLAGGEHKALRAAINRLDREGFVFRVMDVLEVQQRLPELREISDEWLTTKHAAEKGFSLGFFDPGYVARFPTGIIERRDRIEGFANLWLGGGRDELSPDLMRHRADAPRPVMDALFAHLMLWGKDQGYRWLNLGMAPLSGLPDLAGTQNWLALCRFVYHHGEFFYNFQGLRAYKDKFDPVWEPRYLVYPGGVVLPRVLADVTALIAGGYRHIFGGTRGRAA
jgi:phosphatidylglycerol lysyltransferase